MSGLTDEGFEAETVDTLKTAIENELKTAFGESFNVRPTSVAGILIGIFSQKLADLYEQAEAIYGSQYPDTAFGASLDQLASLTGVQRLAATRSEAVCGVTGTPGTVIPTGSRIKNSDTNTYWRLQADGGDVTIPAASATTGTFESEEFGEVLGVAGTLDTIDTVISGWASVNNDLDADLGRDLETDAELRLRRANLLQVEGAGTLDSIRTEVLSVEGVEQVTMLENVTMSTDGNGLPAKSFETLVLHDSADLDEIAQAIWDTKPAGISAFGSDTGTAVDSLGADQVMAFSVADDVLIYVSLTATTSAGFSSSDNIKLSIIEYGDALLMGDDVYKAAAEASAFIPGVINVPGFKLDIYSSPTATADISIGVRQIARFDTSRISVVLA